MKTSGNVTRGMLAILLLAACGIAQATDVVTNINDLTWGYSGGASEQSTGPDSLTIRTDKNSTGYATLPMRWVLGIGDTMTVTCTAQIDYAVVDTGSTLDLSFADTQAPSTGGTLYGNYYNFLVKLTPADTANGVHFAEGEDTNLGKYNEATTWGTTAHKLVFEIERTAANTMELSFTSPTLSPTTRTVENDVTPLGMATCDFFSVEFRGNGWNENANEVDVTISKLLIESTGSPIPEPATGIAAMGLLALLGIARRR